MSTLSRVQEALRKLLPEGLFRKATMRGSEVSGLHMEGCSKMSGVADYELIEGKFCPKCRHLVVPVQYKGQNFCNSCKVYVGGGKPPTTIDRKMVEPTDKGVLLRCEHCGDEIDARARWQSKIFCQKCKTYVDGWPNITGKIGRAHARIWAVGNPWVIGHGDDDVGGQWEDMLQDIVTDISSLEGIVDIEFLWFGNTMYVVEMPDIDKHTDTQLDDFNDMIEDYCKDGPKQNKYKEFLKMYPPSYKYAIQVKPLSEDEKKMVRTRDEEV